MIGITEDRFRALAEAYGANIGRWPAAERAAAADFAVRNPHLAKAVLAEALRLDRVLELDRTEEVNAALRQAILSAAPPGRPANGNWRWLAGAGVGAALMAACAAGVAVGFVLTPPSVAQLVSGAGPGDAGDDVGGLVSPANDAGGA